MRAASFPHPPLLRNGPPSPKGKVYGAAVTNVGKAFSLREKVAQPQAVPDEGKFCSSSTIASQWSPFPKGEGYDAAMTNAGKAFSLREKV